MAFMLHQVDDGHVPAWEYKPVAAITPKVGMALYESSGNLTTAGGANIATYISMVEKDTACTAGDLIPVVRINKGIIFKAPLHSESSLAIGATTDIYTDGLSVAASGSSGSNVEIVDFPEGVKTADALVSVRFVK